MVQVARFAHSGPAKAGPLTKRYKPLMSKYACYETDLKEMSHEDIAALCASLASIDQTDDFEDTLLLAACKNKQIELIEYFLSLGANPNFLNDCGDTPLHVLIDTVTHDEKASLQCIEILLDAGADIEIRGYMWKTPFLRACCRDSLPALKLLVHRGCNASATLSEYGEELDALFFAKIFKLKAELVDYIKSVMAHN